MNEYVLKLYSAPNRPHTARWVTGQFAVMADDEASAVALARSEHAEAIDASNNAVLFDGDRPLWFKAPWDG